MKGVGKIWLKDCEPAEIVVGFDLFIGGRYVGGNSFTKQYKRNQLEDGNDLREEYRLPLPGIVSNCGTSSLLSKLLIYMLCSSKKAKYCVAVKK